MNIQETYSAIWDSLQKLFVGEVGWEVSVIAQRGDGVHYIILNDEYMMDKLSPYFSGIRQLLKFHGATWVSMNLIMDDEDLGIQCGMTKDGTEIYTIEFTL